MVLGTLDAATARKKKARAKPQPTASENWLRHTPGQLVPVDRDGTPIIMQGYRSRAVTRDKELNEPKEPMQRADRPSEDPARQQHLHSAAQPVAVFGRTARRLRR